MHLEREFIPAEGADGWQLPSAFLMGMGDVHTTDALLGMLESGSR